MEGTPCQATQDNGNRWGTTCLPNRLLSLCLGFCGAAHTAVATAVCKTWQLPLWMQDALFKHWFLCDFESSTENDPSISPNGAQTCWKTRYQCRATVQRNWSTGSITATLTIHDVCCMSMMRGTNLIATVGAETPGSVVVFALSPGGVTEVARMPVGTDSPTALVATATDIFFANFTTVQQLTLTPKMKLERAGSYQHPSFVVHAAAERNVLVTADHKISTFIWNTVNKQLLFRIDAARDDYGFMVWDLALDVSRDSCWVAYKNDQIRRISISTGEICQEKDRQVHFGRMRLGNKSRYLMLTSSYEDGKLRIYDAQTLKPSAMVITAGSSTACNDHFLALGVRSSDLFQIRSFANPNQILAEIPSKHIRHRCPSQCDAIRFAVVGSDCQLDIFDFSPA